MYFFPPVGAFLSFFLVAGWGGGLYFLWLMCLHLCNTLYFPKCLPWSWSIHTAPYHCLDHRWFLILPPYQSRLASYFYSLIFLELHFSLSCKKTFTAPFCFLDTSWFPFHLSSQISDPLHSAASTSPFPHSACCSLRSQCSSSLFPWSFSSSLSRVCPVH